MESNSTTEANQTVLGETVLASIQRMEQSFQLALEQVNHRVDELAARTQSRSSSHSPSPKRKEPERSIPKKTTEPPRSSRTKEPECSSRKKTPESWADHTDTVEDLPPWRNDSWDDEDGIEDQEDQRPPTPGLLCLSEETNAIVDCFFHLNFG